MIFLLSTAYWIIISDTPLQFLVPAILIIVRTCYLTRAIRLSLPSSFLLLSLIFVFKCWGDGPSSAVIMVLRVGLLVLLFGHMLKTPPSRVLAALLSLKPFTPLAYFLHYLERLTSLLVKRSSDIQYAVSVRLAQGGLSFRRRVALIVRGGVSLIVEVTYIIEHVHLVLVSRGEVPATGKWRPLPPFAWTVPVGDAICYAAVFCSVLIDNNVFPSELHWLILSRQ